MATSSYPDCFPIQLVTAVTHTIIAQPLTRDNFSPFGDAIFNPGTTVNDAPFPVSPANQGTALKYTSVSNLEDLTSQAPSRNSNHNHSNKDSNGSDNGSCSISARRPGPTMSIFVCTVRKLTKTPITIPTTSQQSPSIFPVKILERHPFTSQTFIPLAPTPNASYLIVVAPTLPIPSSPSSSHSAPNTFLPVPTTRPAPEAAKGEGNVTTRNLAGPGMPDLSRLRAFVCSGHQAVTYAAGTWHAPMVVLRNRHLHGRGREGGQEDGEDGEEREEENDVPLSFVVYQSITGVSIEDCQEVVFSVNGLDDGGEGKCCDDVGANVIVPVVSNTNRSRL